MRTTGTILTLLAMFFAVTVEAQPRLEWSRSYGGQDEDRCMDIVSTPAGGYLLVGYDKSFGHFNEDGWIVCLDENGDSLWSKEFGGDSWDFFFKAVPTDGGYYLIGRYASFEGNLGWDSPWLVKIDGNGEEVWSRTYRDENHGYADVDLELNSDGGLTMSGDAPNSRDFFLRKVDANGQTIWENSYDDNGREERSYGHCQLADGSFIVCGEVAVPADNGQPNGVLIKTDEGGDQIWRHEYGEREFNAFYDAVQLPNGDIAALGMYDNSPWLLRINTAGEVISSHVYRSDYYGYFMRLKLAEDGGLLLFGDRNGSTIIRTDSECELVWELYPPRNDFSSFYSAVTTPDGGLMVGYTSNVNGANFGIAKYGADPTLGWPRWNDLPAVVMNEDEPFELLNDWLDEYVEDIDNDSTGFTFAVMAGQHTAIEAIDGGFRLSSEENWFGIDTLALSVTDPDSHWAETKLAVSVNPVNDLPLAFSLLSPEDGYNLNANQIGFIWEDATQNAFEQDSVRYRLVLSANDSQLVIPNINNSQYIFREVANLRELLGIEGENWFTLTWWIEAVDREGFTESTEQWTIAVMGVMGVEEGTGLPDRFSLSSVSPNPFNSTTTIRFATPATSHVRVTLHDLYGREVQEYMNSEVKAGYHSIAISAGDLPAGLYLVRLESGGKQAVQKVALVR